MTINTKERENAFRVGVIGPSRVGKTSLVAAILRNSQDLLAGTPIEVRANDLATEARISAHRNQLDGALRGGQFLSKSVRATQEPFVFDLLMSSGDREASLEVSILDYPGGWLDPVNRPQLRQKDWEECRDFLRTSTVLIVPIDGTIVMEAVEARHQGMVPAILTTNDVAEVAVSWAKERQERAAQSPPEPGLLILAPLKCESYFADNGGQQDDADKLRSAVTWYYSELIHRVREECRTVTILYSPVDTIGCVELVSGQWRRTEDPPGAEFHAKYRVRGAGRIATKGADTILRGVARHVYEARSGVEAEESAKATQVADSASAYANYNAGLFRNAWFKINGERKRRREAAEGRAQEAQRAEARLKAFHAALEQLSQDSYGPRVSEF